MSVWRSVMAMCLGLAFRGSPFRPRLVVILSWVVVWLIADSVAEIHWLRGVGTRGHFLGRAALGLVSRRMWLRRNRVASWDRISNWIIFLSSWLAGWAWCATSSISLMRASDSWLNYRLRLLLNFSWCAVRSSAMTMSDVILACMSMPMTTYTMSVWMWRSLNSRHMWGITLSFGIWAHCVLSVLVARLNWLVRGTDVLS